MYYGSTYLNEYVYIMIVLLVVNLVVFLDCFIISNLFDWQYTFTDLETSNQDLYA